MRRVHRNPKLNPVWEVGVKKVVFEEMILENRRLNNSQVWRRGYLLESTCVRAIGQEEVWPVSEHLEKL